MNILIIYDSAYGNTNKVAQTMAEAAPLENNVQIEQVTKFKRTHLQGIDLLIVGSPTQGGRPTQDIQNFISSIPKTVIKNQNVAVFDTRFALQEHGRALRFLMRTIGFAAGKMAHALKSRGAILVTEPVGFIVDDKEGPLHEDELLRAQQWIRILVHANALR